ncbi:hypothetical protein M5X00_30005 [Paenibacillus alvei]|uniref:hypothetical protein n=1 Tax=Paenibacillus alvei TaxID=44250 RepID=UPI00028899B8|nr:hypothetical protein [Paenibacillus alvei]EJW14457.1 hypothetical protein PAV_13c00760 [Paenibacillus alvei DSM 29]MCY9543720.1 hypothetical protein [Paenibacillus alvei]MCY9708217.1 hypothetical protein [Paenibacillus alvei]MCY9737925.1 hypothetical protein [Paenibacillus alvei]MCY9758457.1 hypothetical protein [Paenibacillus alvei]
MKPIQYTSPKYQPLPGILPPIPIREWRGVSTYDALSLDDGFFTDMQNMTTDDYPAVSTRPGYSVIGQAGCKVLGLGVWKNRELHAVFNDGTWRRWNGNEWSQLASGLNTSADWSFTSFEGNLDDINLIGSNGADPIKRYDGSSVRDLSGAPAKGNYITTYQNRLWCGVGKELHSCALDRPTEWQKFQGLEDDSYGKDMESTRGEDINMLTGSLTKLTIGMPNSLHELYGNVPSNFNTRLITEDTGLINNKSAITQEGYLRFMHKNGIFEYAGGVLPNKGFSDVIEKLIYGITPESVAGSDGTKLYFQLPDKLLVFDPRAGVQAWSIWRGIQATHFVTMQNQFYIGDAQGRVLRLEGSTDAGNPIPWSVTTKPFNGSSAAMKQRWYKMWLVVELTGTMEVHLSPSISGDDWVHVQSISGGSSPQVKRVIIPVNKFALENWIRVRFSGTGWARIHEFTRQTRQLPLY